MENKSMKNSKTNMVIKQLELFPEVTWQLEIFPAGVFIPSEKKVDDKFAKEVTKDVVKKLGLK